MAAQYLPPSDYVISLIKQGKKAEAEKQYVRETGAASILAKIVVQQFISKVVGSPPHTCIQCGMFLAPDSRFCPSCGLSIDAPLSTQSADSLSDVHQAAVDPHTHFGLVCPNTKCQTQNLYIVDKSQVYNNFVCPKCQSRFSTRIAKVRTGTSRHETAALGNSVYSQAASRRFSIRIKDFNGSEDLVEFLSHSSQTFEFKSSDIVGFTYMQNDLKIVQNFTINRWMNIVKLQQKGGCCGPKFVASTLSCSYLLWLVFSKTH